MADYQSLLTRAVANLPKGHAPTARQAIYERARRALVTQLRTLRPPLPENDITREEAALDRAIAAVEEGFGPIAGGAPASRRRRRLLLLLHARHRPRQPCHRRDLRQPSRGARQHPLRRHPLPRRSLPRRRPLTGNGGRRRPRQRSSSIPSVTTPASRPVGPPPRPAAPAPGNIAPPPPTYPVRPSAPAGPPPLRATSPAPAAGAKPAPAVQVAPAVGDALRPTGQRGARHSQRRRGARQSRQGRTEHKGRSGGIERTA